MSEGPADARPRQALIAMPLLANGGAEAVLKTLARTLDRDPGWAVTVATIGDADRAGHAIGGAALAPGRGGGGAGAEWRLVPALRARRWDLVCSSHLRVNAALCLCRRLGLLRTRRLVTRESTVFQDRYGAGRMAAYRALYRAYGVQDMIVAQTGYMAGRVRELLPARARGLVRVLPNPVDTAEIARAAAVPPDPALAAALRRRPHVAWCGRLIELKRPLLAVETLAALRGGHGVDAGLVVVGDGPLREAVGARAAALGLADAVTLAGHLASPHGVMALCPLGLLTSRREGFPNVLLEMMACGVPGIVTTDCAGDLDTLDGVAVVGGPEEGLAERLAAALARRHGEAQAERAVQPGEAPPPRYAAALARRDADAFAAAILGEPAGPADAGRPGAAA